MLEPPLRRATPEDGPVLAQLANFAGEGLPLHFWTLSAAPGEDPWARGAARAAKAAADGKIYVVDDGDGPVASLTGYAIGPEPEPPGDADPPVFRPLLALEALAPSSWYVNVLAVMPDQRGKGLGGRLLSLAERIAADEGLSALSVIVADANSGARRLYTRMGYQEAAQRAMVKDGWKTEAEAWILMRKSLA